MSKISASSHFVPPGIVPNDALQVFMETSDEWIQTRSGIKERHWVREGNREFKGMTNHQMVYEACQFLFQKNNIDKNDIDAIVYATISPENDFPGSGVELQQLLFSDKNIPIFEVRNQCSGFLYALLIADTYINSGQYSNVLVVGAEIQSSGLSLSNAGRNTAVLFADGCGVLLLQKSSASESGIIDILLKTEGQYADKLGVGYPGYSRKIPIEPQDYKDDALSIYPYMDGKFVFKMASTRMPEIIIQILKKNNLDLNDLDCVIPHQANQRIIDMLQSALPSKIKVFSNIAQYGNTTAASIPLAFSEAVAQGFVQKNHLVCFVSFGAGFSWGAALFRY